MVRIVVEIPVGLLVLAGVLGTVLASLYAVGLSTPRGLEICERRTYWTVIGGHLLMALTMAFVSAELAGLWLFWSVMHGLPLVVRSEWLHWKGDVLAERAGAAAVGAMLRTFRREGVDDAAGGSGSDRGGPGEGSAGE